MSGRWVGGSTRAWRTVRAAVLARDDYRCQMQTSAECVGTASTVHHTQPREVVGDDPAYLISACKPCNYGWGSPTDPKHGDPPAQGRTAW